MSIDSLSPILKSSSVTISHEHELANRWLCRVCTCLQTVGGRCSRCLAIMALRRDLAVAEDAFFLAARNLLDYPGAATCRTWSRCRYHEMAVRAALSAMEDFGLGE